MSLTVRIIAVGDELLEGRTADTNSRRIQRALGEHAVQVAGIRVVPDQLAAIAAALDGTDSGDLVFLSGGLGSTPDDLTRDAVAVWAGVDLPEDPAVRARLEERWRARGIGHSPGVARQCQVPAGLEPLENPVGSAPGLLGSLRGRTLILLPGVPAELAGLLPVVVARLAADGTLPTARSTRLWRTAQVGELAIVERCAAVRAAHAGLAWAWWLTEWGVDVRLAAAADGEAASLEAAAAAVDRQLAGVTFSRTMESLPAAVQRLLIARGATVSVAESCTGGLIGGCLSEESGSSACFIGGVIAYADEVKLEQLGVPASVLTDRGAVSEAAVRAMAAGVRARLNSDYALAVSGISGPGGGTPDKPVGTTWIALATPAAVHARRHRFTADRRRNRLLTVAAAIDALRRTLESDDRTPPWRDDDTWSGR